MRKYRIRLGKDFYGKNLLESNITNKAFYEKNDLNWGI